MTEDREGYQEIRMQKIRKSGYQEKLIRLWRTNLIPDNLMSIT